MIAWNRLLSVNGNIVYRAQVGSKAEKTYPQVEAGVKYMINRHGGNHAGGGHGNVDAHKGGGGSGWDESKHPRDNAGKFN